MLKLDDRRFNRLALTGLAAGLLLLAAAFIAAVTAIDSARRSAETVRHTREVVEQLTTLELQLERVENGRRGFLLAQHPYRLLVYRQNAALAPRTFQRIAALVQDNPYQIARLSQMRGLLNQQLVDARTSVDLALTGRATEARAEFERQSVLTPIRRIRTVTQAMQAEENRLLAERSAQEEEVRGLVDAVLWITGILLLILGPAIFWLVRRYTRDLTASRNELADLNRGLEDAVEERTADLRRANEEIQRFAYIVSHDLRSPLVNIMGFTAELESATKSTGAMLDRVEGEAPQLVHPDARFAVREDLPEAIGFIRSSTQKMDRLINAILRLSREGRRNLTPERLEMNRLIEGIADTLEHRVAESGAEILVQPSLPEIVNDRVAIEQVFSNLVENAVKYADPGRPVRIAVRGERSGDRTIFEVSDNGRGIDPKDHQRIFDLFRRSGMQDQPGEGIGLAHVRALVYRLSGTIDVRSSLGEGSTFRLVLPAVYRDGERKE